MKCALPASAKPAVRSGDDYALVGQQGAVVILFEVEHILVVITAEYRIVGQVCVWRTVIDIIRMAGTDICTENIIKTMLRGTFFKNSAKRPSRTTGGPPEH